MLASFWIDQITRREEKQDQPAPLLLELPAPLPKPVDAPSEEERGLVVIELL